VISGKAYSTKPFHVIERFLRSNIVKPQQGRRSSVNIAAKQAERRKYCSKESGA